MQIVNGAMDLATPCEVVRSRANGIALVRTVSRYIPSFRIRRMS
jgi:hypothetical protein